MPLSWASVVICCHHVLLACRSAWGCKSPWGGWCWARSWFLPIKPPVLSGVPCAHVSFSINDNSKVTCKCHWCVNLGIKFPTRGLLGDAFKHRSAPRDPQMCLFPMVCCGLGGGGRETAAPMSCTPGSERSILYPIFHLITNNPQSRATHSTLPVRKVNITKINGFIQNSTAVKHTSYFSFLSDKIIHVKTFPWMCLTEWVLVCTGRCDQPHCLSSSLTPFSRCCSFLLPQLLGTTNPFSDSTVLPILDISLQMQSYNMWPSVSGFFYFTRYFQGSSA